MQDRQHFIPLEIYRTAAIHQKHNVTRTGEPSTDEYSHHDNLMTSKTELENVIDHQNAPDIYVGMECAHRRLREFALTRSQ